MVSKDGKTKDKIVQNKKMLTQEDKIQMNNDNIRGICIARTYNRTRQIKLTKRIRIKKKKLHISSNDIWYRNYDHSH